MFLDMVEILSRIPAHARHIYLYICGIFSLTLRTHEFPSHRPGSCSPVASISRHNASRSSTRNQERPAETTTNGSAAARLVQQAGIIRTAPS